MAETALIGIVAVIAATYAGYPLMVLAAAALAGSRRAAARRTGTPPSLTILICAHNEEASLGAKLETVVDAAAAWGGEAEIIVADDGSVDRTGAIAAEHAASSPVPFRLLTLPRGGKAAALSAGIAAAAGEILVLTDADPLFDPQTLPALISPFDDPEVGAVAGEVRPISAAGGFSGGESLFRRYESAIRTAEDRLFGCVSADGGLYAIRAALAEPVPADATDDFFLSTAAVAGGARIAFRPAARVFEGSPEGSRQHFRRRLRITVRGLTSLWRRRALMNPARTGWYAVGLVFHKLLRRFAPVLLVPLWLLSGWLAWRGEGAVYGWLFGLMALGAAAAAVLMLLPLKLPRPLRLPLYAAVHISGLTLGAFLFLAGRRYTQWTPQQRS